MPAPPLTSRTQKHAHEYTLGEARTEPRQVSSDLPPHTHALLGGALTGRTMTHSAVHAHAHVVDATQTFDAQVEASGDDGWTAASASFNNSGTQGLVGEQPTRSYNGWYRWDNVTIPAGATILTAYITVVGRATGNDGAGTKANIYLCDEDDPAAPTTYAEHDADPRTTAFTAWDDVDFIVDAVINSPSIVDVVQEISDRPGWSSGQAMMALLDDDGSASSQWYDWYTYDGDSSKAVKLHVEYVP